MDKNIRTRSITLAAAALTVGICMLAIIQSLHVVDLGHDLRLISQRMELMTSVADAQATISSEE